MAIAVRVQSMVGLNVSFTINESEARALSALAGYGIDEFINMFYRNLGKTYLQPHEVGLRSFLRSVKSIVDPAIYELDKARAMLKTSEGQY